MASVRYGGDGGADSVDGGRIQWREVIGGEEMIRRPEEAEQDTRRLRGFEENFQNLTCGYIYPDPVGVTEWNNSVAPRLQNRKRLLKLGVTEVF